MTYQKWVRSTRMWFYRHTPAWFRERDFEVFTAILCFLAGAPLLFTNQFEAQTVNAALPFLLVKLWAAILTLAPVLVLVGVIRSVQTPYPARAFWLRIEALGLTGLAYAGYVYAASIMTLPVQRWAVIPIILIFAITCHFREVAIQIDLSDFKRGIGANGR